MDKSKEETIEHEKERKKPKPSVSMPPNLLNFLEEEDSSQKCRQMVKALAQKLSILTGKQVTLSLHKPYICFWDFNEWRTFAYGQIVQNSLYVSLEENFVPSDVASDLWTPPSGLCKTKLVRFKVDTVSDNIIFLMKNALIQRPEFA
jgi:hypothetical protein